MDEMKSGLTFEQAKGMADRAIRDVKNGIVSAGYALKAIRSERLWVEQGFTSFDDFMEHCYQKDKSWASNCIRVYEQFGELAGPEQTPKLKERYQEYSAGGLIEMLSMPDELREQVTADMPVREIRELKREARKVATSELETDPEGEQLEGQMEIYDFPEFMPEPCAAEMQQLEGDAAKAQQEEKPEPEEWEEKDGWTARETGGSDVIHVTELADDMDEWDGQGEEPVAERQPEPDPNTSCPPGISSCTREHWGTSDAEQEKGRKECRACWKRWRELGEPMKPLAFWRKQELPRMKNNDQRKEWLRNYQDWGLWYEDEHIGVRYYKYDFENGARLIAEEYPTTGKRDFTTYYLHLVGGPEPPKHPSYGCPRWSRHVRYGKHPDSETELVEFLKAVQR